jgi:ribosomal protein S18 acetylase RimI-like enzyme
MNVAQSPLEQERFGVRTARAETVTTASLPALLAFCAEQDVQLAIARVPTDDPAAVQALEATGFRLMDTLVTYVFDSERSALSGAGGSVLVRPATPDDRDAVVGLASSVFARYGGHYHADPRLDRAACDAVYTDWTERSLASRGPDREVFVAADDDAILGSIIMRVGDDGRGRVDLGAVAATARGRGVYPALLAAGVRWCIGRGMPVVAAPTQITNIAAQRAYTRFGFAIESSVYTLHKWFD